MQYILSEQGKVVVAHLIETHIGKIAHKNWKDFAGEDGPEIDEEALICEALEANGFDCYRADSYAQQVADSPKVKQAFDGMRDTIHELMLDAKEWQHARTSPGAMLRYHGMATSDFI